MKTAVFAITLALVASLGVGCHGIQSKSDVPIDLQPVFDQLVKDEAAAKVTSGVEDDAEVEARWGQLEGEVAKRQAAPFAPLLPAGLGALGLELVAALASKRKRTLYKSAIQNISSGQVAAAAGDALKAWGVQHSQPQPQAES